MFYGASSSPCADPGFTCQIGLEIPYAPVFSPSAPPVTLRNLLYERAAVLFNLAALYSSLAAGQDRSTAQGLKQMIAHYQVGRSYSLRGSQTDNY